jgi:hypothetical protein
VIFSPLATTLYPERQRSHFDSKCAWSSLPYRNHPTNDPPISKSGQRHSAILSSSLSRSQSISLRQSSARAKSRLKCIFGSGLNSGSNARCALSNSLRASSIRLCTSSYLFLDLVYHFVSFIGALEQSFGFGVPTV